MTDINTDAFDTDALFDDSVWINGEKHQIKHTRQEGNTCQIHLEDPIALSDEDGSTLVNLYVVNLSID